MQSHHYALAAGITWLVTLLIVPVLLTKVRRRAYASGVAAGKALQDQALKLQLKGALRDQEDLRALLDRTKQECQLQMDARQAGITALKASIAELEARIMSYTGLAVTKTDYDQLITAADTLRLTQRTLAALKSEPHASHAGRLAEAMDALAKRIHAQLRTTPATAATAGAAA